MNRATAKRLWEVIKAYGEGKTIQVYNEMAHDWLDDTEYSEIQFNLNSSQLRIKPEENYTIEQNCGENRTEGGVLSVSGSVSDIVEVCSTCVNRRNCPYPNYQHKCEHYLEEKLYVVENERGKLEIRVNLADGFTSETRASIPVLFRGTLEECSLFVQDYEKKKEKTYRAFKDCSELVNHCGIKLIWVKHKEYGTEFLITSFDNRKDLGTARLPCVCIQDMWVDFEELLEGYTFLDGSPCGCLEE